MTRTLEQQFDDAEALASRQFPDEPGKRQEYHIELLKEIARGLAYRMLPLQVRGEIADELTENLTTKG